MSEASALPQPSEAVIVTDAGFLTSSTIFYHVLATVIALIIAIALWYVVKKGVSTICRHSVLSELELLIMKITRWVYWLLAGVVILQQMGFNTENLWTTLTAVAAMVAVGFIAVWSVLSNFVSSFLILSSRLFKPRDEIEVLDIGGGSIKGRVRSIDLMFTIVEESNANGGYARIKIPNNIFFQKVMRVHYTAGNNPETSDEPTARTNSTVALAPALSDDSSIKPVESK
jgi:small-conductance mechanosensitive channel